MKKFILLILLCNPVFLAANEIPNQISCRVAVVQAYQAVGINISPNSFSSKTFDQYYMSANQFNALPNEQQIEIYRNIRPLKATVEETFKMINAYIGMATHNEDDIRLADILQVWRKVKDQLTICTYN